MTSTRRVYIAGHRGLVGSALCRILGADASVEFVHPTDRRVELRDRSGTFDAIRNARPDVVVLVAARVGGIGANLADPVGFFEDNLRIEMNVVGAAHAAGVPRLLFIGSANSYPHDAAQPIVEAALGTGAIDHDTLSYGASKLVGVQLCNAYSRQHGVAYHSIIPSNLYGPGDRFDLATAHVVAATLRRFNGAREAGHDEVVVWGSGRQRRQLLHSEDLARACQILLTLDAPPAHVNAAPTGDTAISEIADIAAEITGFTGKIAYDTSKPEGVVRRELDTSELYSLGWQPQFDLPSGMRMTWDWFCDQQAQASQLEEANA